jgi:hypothetical protein
MDQQQKKQAQFSGAYLFLAFAALLLVQGIVARRTAPKSVPMSELVQLVKDGKVTEAQVRGRDRVDHEPPRGGRGGRGAGLTAGP